MQTDPPLRGRIGCFFGGGRGRAPADIRRRRFCSNALRREGALRLAEWHATLQSGRHLFGPKPAENTPVCKTADLRAQRLREAAARRWPCHRVASNRFGPQPSGGTCDEPSREAALHPAAAADLTCDSNAGRSLRRARTHQMRASAAGGFGPPRLRAMRVQTFARRNCGLPHKCADDRRASPTASAATSHRSSKNGNRAPGHSRRSAANPRRHRRRRAAAASKRAGGNW